MVVLYDICKFIICLYDKSLRICEPPSKCTVFKKMKIVKRQVKLVKAGGHCFY